MHAADEGKEKDCRRSVTNAAPDLKANHARPPLAAASSPFGASWQAGLETVHRPLTVERVERDVEDEPARRAARPQDEPRGERV
jgi:hypothetical protein